MNILQQTSCTCSTCPGTGCNCGCQQVDAQRVAQAACACGVQCACGAQCQCGAACQCGATANCAQS